MKSAVLRLQEAHLEHARAERAHYQDLCQQSRQVAHDLQELHVRNITFHYSCDFAQVHFPSLQPGPIYFKTPRICQIIGTHADGASKQVNYLVDECVSCGKGANVVISYLHHFVDNNRAGECHLQLNADNCGGQNKNNFILWYLACRVATVVVPGMESGHGCGTWHGEWPRLWYLAWRVATVVVPGMESGHGCGTWHGEWPRLWYLAWRVAMVVVPGMESGRGCGTWHGEWLQLWYLAWRVAAVVVPGTESCHGCGTWHGELPPASTPQPPSHLYLLATRSSPRTGVSA